MSTLRQDLNFKPEINVTGTGNGNDWEVSTDKDKFELSIGIKDQTITITAGNKMDYWLMLKSIGDIASLTTSQMDAILKTPPEMPDELDVDICVSCGNEVDPDTQEICQTCKHPIGESIYSDDVDMATCGFCQKKVKESDLCLCLNCKKEACAECNIASDGCPKCDGGDA